MSEYVCVVLAPQTGVCGLNWVCADVGIVILGLRRVFRWQDVASQSGVMLLSAGWVVVLLVGVGERAKWVLPKTFCQSLFV